MNPDTVEALLCRVRGIVGGSLDDSPLGFLAQDLSGCLGGGKMLRARLVLRVGAATGMASADRIHAACAVELVHAASLLHDDVIDHGRKRRGKPTLWVRHGVKSAILVGDLLLCRSMSHLVQVRGVSLADIMAARAEEMCAAELEQELLRRDQPPDWGTCVGIARRKTGSLFAFAAEAAAGPAEPLKTVLREAGYAAGTAYQLADDLLDAYGDPAAADKTLRSDQAGGKATAATVAASEGVDPVATLRALCASARTSLAGWPAVQREWDRYMAEDLSPAMDGFLAAARSAAEAPTGSERGSHAPCG